MRIELARVNDTHVTKRHFTAFDIENSVTQDISSGVNTQ